MSRKLNSSHVISFTKFDELDSSRLGALALCGNSCDGCGYDLKIRA